jgi:hypothetical protein
MKYQGRGDAMATRSFYVMLFTLALLAAAPPLHGAARGLTTSLDLSAQTKPDDKDKVKKGPPPHKPQPNVQHKPAVVPKQNVQQKNNNQQKHEKNNVQQLHKNLQQKQNVQQQQKQNVQQQQQKQQNVQHTQQNQQQKKFTGKPKTFTPKHNQVVNHFKLKNSNRAVVSGRNYSVYRRDYRIRRNGGWRTFVALGVLAPLLIGASEYYPYAYMDVPEAYCDGLTDDGCELVYDDVETEEGDVIPQCVAYCPWQQ